MLHTWTIDAADSTPYLEITSAEKKSGKTRLLEVLYELASRPYSTANISDAALFRVIGSESTLPALLFDEGDAIRKMDGPTRWELLRRLGDLGGPPIR